MHLDRRTCRRAGRQGLAAVAGASAGGHLAANLTVRFDAPTYVPTDDADQLPGQGDGGGVDKRLES